MFLLFHWGRTPSKYTSSIYIPICFYYFGMERATVFVALTWFTFQYVSIISIKSVKKYSRRNLIYIPICFYYFSMPITANTTAGKIYIPICFYYFCLLVLFFHKYFPIYIPICFYYFWLTWAVLSSVVYLHSNMFLLFPSKELDQLRNAV